MSSNWKRACLWIPCLAAACSFGTSPEDLASTMVAETAAAATDTPEPTGTSSPTAKPLPPTATSTSTLTPTPGPVVFQDEFSNRTADWLLCDEREWKDGALFMGPYPVSGAYHQHTAVCGACGLVRNYRMGVDVAYGEGPSERGFGLLVRLNDDRMTTFEITPWQTAILWDLDFQDDFWNFVNGFYTGRVHAGRSSNRIEVEVNEATAPGLVNIELRVNSRTVFLAYNQPGESGAVGLTLFGHAMSAVFDNFEFEELAPFSHEPFPPSGPPPEFGQGDGANGG